MDRKIEINLKSLLIFSALAGAIYLIWQIREVLFIVLVAYLISAVILPLINLLRSRKFSENAAILTSYFLVIVLLVLVGGMVLPPLISESTKFYARFPEIFDNVSRQFQIDTTLINQNLQTVGENLVALMLKIVSNTVGFITIFVVSIYLTFERKHFKDYLQKLFGEEKGRIIERVIDKIDERLGKWINAQILLCLIIGIEAYVGLTLLGFPYAVALAVIAGILEAVPNIGPIASALPAAVIGFSHSPWLGVTAIALYTLIHQSENHIVVPRVMGQAAGLRPLAVIIVLLIGGSLLGTVGVILAIPAFLAGQVIVEELANTGRNKN